MKKHNCYVVDTNVAIPANRGNESTAADVQFCVDILTTIIGKGCIVIDSGGAIFEEYSKHLSRKGVPGLGDSFIKWLFDNQYSSPNIIHQVITETASGYEEFPVDDKLDKFDKSDMKFVAVANALTPHPIIVEATDSKWWKWAITLKKHNIKVKFADPEKAKKGCQKKNKCKQIDCGQCDA